MACEDRLNDIQEELDEAYMDYLKSEFDIKLAHHKKIAGLLESRDSLMRESYSAEELAEFYCDAFTNFDAIQDFLPTNAEGQYDTSFIKSLRAEYQEGGRLRVVVELHENDYVKNSVLDKTVFIEDKDPEGAKVEWKNEARPCVLFNFFEVDEDSYDLFDIIYELYVNLVAHKNFVE